MSKVNRFDVITIFPDYLAPLSLSLIGKAQSSGLIEIGIHDLRAQTIDVHGSVDDTPYGGGAGMVMMVQPIDDCISHLKSQRHYDEIIYMSPDGETLNQKMANTASMYENIIILCGHYKGVDERIREHYITKEISIGSYVLSGGELAAAVLVDSIVRLIPGVLNDETSALTDSFQDNILSPPVYTRPPSFNGWEVPEVLLSGNPKEIELWREREALKRTKIRRPDLLD